RPRPPHGSCSPGRRGRVPPGPPAGTSEARPYPPRLTRPPDRPAPPDRPEPDRSWRSDVAAAPPHPTAPADAPAAVHPAATTTLGPVALDLAAGQAGPDRPGPGGGATAQSGRLVRRRQVRRGPARDQPDPARGGTRGGALAHRGRRTARRAGELPAPRRAAGGLSGAGRRRRLPLARAGAGPSCRRAV